MSIHTKEAGSNESSLFCYVRLTAFSILKLVVKKILPLFKIVYHDNYSYKTEK